MRRSDFPQWLAGALIVLTAGCLFAQTADIPANAPRPVPYPALTPSPVELFRMLLTTNAAGREAWLATRPQSRRVIEAKLSEYQGMTPEERDARLLASQLRWYLPPLMNMPPADRERVLSAIPQPERKLIQQRLGELGILPPALQNGIITNQTVFRLFEAAERRDGSNNNMINGITGEQRVKLEQQYQTWRTLVDLPPKVRTKTLSQLTETERTQMELTLSQFRNLGAAEREQALRGFKKFAELSPLERAIFLKTAERWRTMSESDRALWRKIVALLQSPSTPPPLPNPPMARPQPDSSTLIATNY
jgi:hypothetical protein